MVEIEYTSLNGETNTLQIPLGKHKSAHSENNSYSYTFDVDTSTGVFKIMNFMARSEFEEMWVEFVTEAKEQSLENIVIDVRESYGGYSLYHYTDAIFSSLGIHEYQTPYPEYYRRAFKKTKSLNVSRTEEPLKYENLYVATSNYTVSAPTMFATTVRDNNLGTIIGQPVANNLAFYGSGEYDFEYLKFGASIGGGTLEYANGDGSHPLQPDVYIPVTREHIRNDIDPMLEWMKNESTAQLLYSLK